MSEKEILKICQIIESDSEPERYVAYSKLKNEDELYSSMWVVIEMLKETCDVSLTEAKDFFMSVIERVYRD